MTDWTLSALHGAVPVHYLAVLGLAAAVESATVVFTSQGVPVLAADAEEEAVVQAVIAELERLTLPDLCPLPASMTTTTPAWSQLAPVADASWHDPVLDRLVRTFDTGSTKPVRAALDRQVVAASLTLISGKSYLRKSLETLWPTSARSHDRQTELAGLREQRRQDLVALLHGQRPSTVHGGLALRFTTSETSPRIRTGLEESQISPLLEGLALAGQTLLLPHQCDLDGRRGMTWTCNPVPLDTHALIALHETRSAPRTWPRYCANVVSIGGGTKASRFTPSTQVETT